MGEWSTVWECPSCGSQIAMGEKGVIEVTMTKVPRCTLGHAPTEMEQKLAPAMPLTVEDANG